ncbi:MAG: hypothetical protein Q4F67_11805 [Propionibacteriaceae bacterium]|nr:hypothetical protein [Propionibacteriaceae bacterium]
MDEPKEVERSGADDARNAERPFAPRIAAQLGTGRGASLMGCVDEPKEVERSGADDARNAERPFAPRIAAQIQNVAKAIAA